MVLLGLVLALFTVRIEQGLLRQGEEIAILNGIERVMVMSRAAWFYAGKILWPGGLCFDYGLWSLRPFTAFYLVPLVLLIVVLGLLWLRRSSWGRGPLSATLFYLGTALPALGLVSLFFHRYAYVADHFVYLPSLGLLVPAAVLIVRGLGRLPHSARSLGSAVLAALLLVMAVLTWQRARAFENLETLARRTLECNDGSWLAHNNLGNEYLRRGELAASLRHLRRADAIAPDRVETQANLAIVLMNLGEFEQAEHRARRVMALKPRNALGFRLLGDNFLRVGNPAAAAPAYAEAIERDSTPARTSLAYALAGLGRQEEAIGHLQAALALDPGNESIRINLERLRGGSSP
jgi:tetratricopeptide (TPR) repeat protein